MTTTLAALTLLAATSVAEPEPAVEAKPPEPGPQFTIPIVHSLVMMTGMRIGASILWPHPFSEPETFGAYYEQAYTELPKFDSSQPFMRWDGDPLVVNVLGHGLFGSELYLRARQCHFGWAGSLAFATVGSTLWEYVFEANGAQPSALDLVYTPLMGMALGEGRYAIHRLAGGIASPVGRGIVRAVVDPFGELERFAGAGC